MRRSVFIIALAAVLASAIGIGASLAWLAVKTNTADNLFTLTGPDGLTGEIVEQFNPEDAQGLTPGDTVTKVVSVTNTSPSDMSEWVAVKLTFLEGDGRAESAVLADMGLLNQVIALSYGSAGQTYNDGVWVRKNSGPLQSTEVFYYNQLLAANATTRPLFDTVSVLGTADNALLTTIKDVWGGFDIRITGAVVQGDISATFDPTVTAELDGMLN